MQKVDGIMMADETVEEGGRGGLLETEYVPSSMDREGALAIRQFDPRKAAWSINCIEYHANDINVYFDASAFSEKYPSRHVKTCCCGSVARLPAAGAMCLARLSMGAEEPYCNIPSS